MYPTNELKIQKDTKYVPTCASVHVPFFKLFRYGGIYPYSFEFYPVPENFKGVRPIRKIGTEKSGTFVVLNRIVVLIHILQWAYLVGQLGWEIFSQDTDAGTLLNLVAWTGTCSLGLVIVIKYYRSGESICELITEVDALEAEIYEKYKAFIPSGKKIHNHKAEFRSLVLQMCVFSITGATVTIMKHLKDPMSPVFMYNVFSKISSSPCYHSVFLTISVTFQGLYIIYDLGFMVQLVATCLNFCRIVGTCIGLISYREEKSGKFELLGEMEQSLKYYKRLNELMTQSNKLFAWVLAISMGGYSLMGCVVAYLPIYYWTSSSPLSLLGYVFLFFTVVYIFCRVIPRMGEVYEVTKNFRMSWLRGVAYSRGSLSLIVEQRNYLELLRLRLDTCVPFGFKCGNFFIINTVTILTFFSAISTYLIIMLQFGIK
ncbi:hypothetical protein Fcan01_19830 [Folsomia candida]|uniref:Gustatory receptor n=1 Tax=Folsomia candida TaxID=158441 RepID=A0A226DIW0_FOLCA|nr:hypothetical protein Fcan01_19830 [Folsomia candida]